MLSHIQKITFIWIISPYQGRLGHTKAHLIHLSVHILVLLGKANFRADCSPPPMLGWAPVRASMLCLPALIKECGFSALSPCTYPPPYASATFIPDTVPPAWPLQHQLTAKRHHPEVQSPECYCWTNWRVCQNHLIIRRSVTLFLPFFFSTNIPCFVQRN